MFRSLIPLSAAALLCTMPAVLLAQRDTSQVDVEVVAADSQIPPNLMLRARVVAITPEEHAPTDIVWRYGGQGVTTGESKSGVLAKAIPLGEWSDRISLASILPKKVSRRVYLGIGSGNRGRMVDRETRAYESYSTNVEMEFEFSDGDQPLKILKASGPNGGMFTLVIPADRLSNETPLNNPDFLEGLQTVLSYAQKRAGFLESLPWAKEPVPNQFTIVTDLKGYGEGGLAYGVHHTDPEVIRQEAHGLRQLGVNGLRDAPPFLIEKAAARDGFAAGFSHAIVDYAGGFPVVPYRKGRAVLPGAGCPYSPAVKQLTAEMVEKARIRLLEHSFSEVWALTVDEIGSVFDGTPEGKGHMAECNACIKAFQEFLQAQGMQPSDFGKNEWTEVKPLNLWAKNDEPKPWLEDPVDPAIALTAYYTRRFNNYSTARLFEPLRDFFHKANRRKQEVLNAGQTDARAAKWPWVYTYALRGQTFITRGHSLDFFEFYRYADNAFVYETSSRDARIWQWDSYVCDVGRTLAATEGVAQGVYIKPHRGAVMQRTLSAASRGFRMIFWYTYGPDYAKGDSFSQRDDLLQQTSKTAHLLAGAEKHLYGMEWAAAPEIAIVSPFSLNGMVQGITEKYKNPALAAAWEDSKWTYLALSHAHLPVQAVDHAYLAERDLSHLKAIYVPSPVLERAAYEKLLQWVKNGGMLYTNANGLAHDEGARPFAADTNWLGLAKREKAEMWSNVPLYAGGALDAYRVGSVGSMPAKGATVSLGGENLSLTVGREVLEPVKNAEVLARFDDGNAAMIRIPHGKGWIYLAGFYPALEYSYPLRTHDYNMGTGLNAALRTLIAKPALDAGVKPVVSCDAPSVEGVLLKNPKGGERSLVLMNWGYRAGAQKVRVDRGGNTQVVGAVPLLIPHTNLKVRVSGLSNITKATSLYLKREIPVTQERDHVTLTLPELQEGDVIIFQ